MKSTKAQELIKKILEDIDRSGIITNTVIKDLQELRPYAVEEHEPVIAKAIRLTFEHIDTYGTFAVPIPEDEPIEDVEVDFEMHEEETETMPTKPEESLAYLVALMKDAGNRRNLQEIREFNAALIAYAEEN